MTQTTMEKKNISDFAFKLTEIAQKEGWVLRYDTESDEASYSVPELSDDARIRYVNDEIALYFSKDKIQGIFIEYFRKNFIQHQPENVNDLKVLDQEIGHASKDNGLVELSWKKVDKIAPNLDDAIKIALSKK